MFVVHAKVSKGSRNERQSCKIGGKLNSVSLTFPFDPFLWNFLFLTFDVYTKVSKGLNRLGDEM